MLICCLMPTFGRPQRLLENSIACFLQQTHAEKMLVGLDDTGRGHSRQGRQPLWCLTSVRRRSPSLPAKYDFLTGTRHADAYAVWDDDDVYLPWHLAAHAQALGEHGWSKPSKVWSTYSGEPLLEPAAGRFHGSIAMRRELLEEVGGWLGVMPAGEPLRADFDQRMITALARIQPPGDPCVAMPPQYVFRWADTGAGHCQGRMRSQEDVTWYTGATPQCTEPIKDLRPRLDRSGEGLFAALARRGPELQAHDLGRP